VHLTFHRELVQCLEEVTPRTEACGKKNTLFLYHLQFFINDFYSLDYRTHVLGMLSTYLLIFGWSLPKRHLTCSHWLHSVFLSFWKLHPIHFIFFWFCVGGTTYKHIYLHERIKRHLSGRRTQELVRVSFYWPFFLYK